MTYQPTKEQREELQALWYIYYEEPEKLELCFSDYVTMHYDVILHRHYISKDTSYRGVIYIDIYPQSKSDIECLIRMLNPNK